MKRKLQWKGPVRAVAYDRAAHYIMAEDLSVTITIEGKGHSALAKRIGDFLKAETKEQRET